MAFPFKKLFMPSDDDKDKLYGSKPEYSSPGTAAGEATAANLANLPEIQKLGSKINTFNQEQLLTMLKKAIPGFENITEKQSSILQSQLRGEVPADVQNQLGRYAAAKGIKNGAIGGGSSGFNRNLEARDFGMTSLDITNKALDSASRWTGSMAQLTQPGMFNVGSAFVTPQFQYDHNKLVSDTNAAPDPGERGAFDSKMSALGMMLGVYGGAGYQGAARSPGATAPAGPMYNTVDGRLGPSTGGWGAGGIYE